MSMFYLVSMWIYTVSQKNCRRTVLFSCITHVLVYHFFQKSRFVYYVTVPGLSGFKTSLQRVNFNDFLATYKSFNVYGYV